VELIVIESAASDVRNSTRISGMACSAEADGRSRFADNEDFSAVGLRVMGSLGLPFSPVPKNTARRVSGRTKFYPSWGEVF